MGGRGGGGGGSSAGYQRQVRGIVSGIVTPQNPQYQIIRDVIRTFFRYHAPGEDMRIEALRSEMPAKYTDANIDAALRTLAEAHNRTIRITDSAIRLGEPVSER